MSEFPKCAVCLDKYTSFKYPIKLHSHESVCVKCIEHLNHLRIERCPLCRDLFQFNDLIPNIELINELEETETYNSHSLIQEQIDEHQLFLEKQEQFIHDNDDDDYDEYYDNYADEQYRQNQIIQEFLEQRRLAEEQRLVEERLAEEQKKQHLLEVERLKQKWLEEQLLDQPRLEQEHILGMSYLSHEKRISFNEFNPHDKIIICERLNLLNRQLLLETSGIITMNPRRIQRLLDNLEIDFFDNLF